MWFPVEVTSTSSLDGLGISHDASPRGILFASGVKMDVGTSITIKFRVSKDAPEQTVTGKVVRVEVNDDDPTGMWPNRLAVSFEAPILGEESLRPPKP